VALLAIEGLRKSYEVTEVLKGIDLSVDSGTNRAVKAVMDGGSPIDADIFYPPAIIIPAIGLTVLRSTTQVPVQGRYVLDSPLITRENAGDYYFPASPY
jgi:ribose transport system substrate-binding protein